MNRCQKIFAIVIVIISLIFFQSCSHVDYSSTRLKHGISWHAVLDNCRQDDCLQIEFWIIDLQTTTAVNPKREYKKHEYRQFIIKMRQGNWFSMDRVIEDNKLKTGKTNDLLCEDVEIHTNPEQKKVWFVYKPTNHVIATIDLTNGGKTTGPNKRPPAWASPDGGLLLDTTCKGETSLPLSEWLP